MLAPLEELPGLMTVDGHPLAIGMVLRHRSQHEWFEFNPQTAKTGHYMADVWSAKATRKHICSGATALILRVEMMCYAFGTQTTMYAIEALLFDKFGVIGRHQMRDIVIGGVVDLSKDFELVSVGLPMEIA